MTDVGLALPKYNPNKMCLASSIRIRATYVSVNIRGISVIVKVKRIPTRIGQQPQRAARSEGDCRAQV